MLLGITGMFGCGDGSREEMLTAEEELSGAGTVVKSYGMGGTANIALLPSMEGMAIRDTAIFSDGGLLVLGTVFAGAATRSYVLRITKDGDLDASYGTGGIFSRSGSFERVYVLPGDRALLGGQALVRLTPGGQLDPSFGVGGVRTWTPKDVGIGAGTIGAPKVLDVESEELLEDGSGGFFSVVAPTGHGVAPAPWHRVLHVDADGTILNPFPIAGIQSGNLSADGQYHRFLGHEGALYFTSKYVANNKDHGTKIGRADASADFQAAESTFVEKLPDIDGVMTSVIGMRLLPFGHDHLAAVRSDAGFRMVLTALDQGGHVDPTFWSKGTYAEDETRFGHRIVAGAPDSDALYLSMDDYEKKPGLPGEYHSTIRRIGQAGDDAKFPALRIEGMLGAFEFTKGRLFAIGTATSKMALLVTKIRR